jgi:SagB-type dehydrogenase family enzyme
MTSSLAALKQILIYHTRSKHQLDRYAAGPKELDWATQPDPFRYYAGAESILLERPEPVEKGPDFDTVVEGKCKSEPLSARLVAQLLYDALAISAWKIAGGNRWAVRCNPSSGNLHPTEAHLLLPAIQGIGTAPALYHYRVRDHALERRITWTAEVWREAMAALPPSGFLIALTSIHWREAWKYGERAYRYCQHDVGHAVAQIAYAAATLGWYVRILGAIGDDDIAQMIKITTQAGEEDAEHPEVLLVVSPQPPSPAVAATWLPPVSWITSGSPPQGIPNRLSPRYRRWPEISRVTAAACHTRGAGVDPYFSVLQPVTSNSLSPRSISARHLFRTRRSAISMDGQSNLPKHTFGLILKRLLRTTPVPWAAFPWRVAIHPVFLIHRITGLAPGMYLLIRDPDQETRLHNAFQNCSVWKPVAGLPEGVQFICLGIGDVRQFAYSSNCYQSIAANGIFAVTMLADFKRTLQKEGPWAYRRLFWEAGMLGQVLYLEAEAAGLRGTGIGCFFDDVIHDAFGFSGNAFQSLYGFTVGGPVEDYRIQSAPAYGDIG